MSQQNCGLSGLSSQLVLQTVVKEIARETADTWNSDRVAHERHWLLSKGIVKVSIWLELELNTCAAMSSTKCAIN
jgi:hypothetical protein